MAYRIKNWGEHFENSRTRQLGLLNWVPIPNKHDGEGYRTIMAQPDGIVIYGCWVLIIAVASKCHPRGTLVKSDGSPLTAKAIAIKTGAPEKDITRALSFISTETDWLECHPSATMVSPECHPGATPSQEMDAEWNGREGNGKLGVCSGGAGGSQCDFHTNPPTEDEFLKAVSMVALPEQEKIACYHHYNGQGWVKGASKAPITNLVSIAQRWKTEFEARKSQQTSKNGTQPNKIDRNAGTFNEGTADQYANLGRLGRHQNPK